MVGMPEIPHCWFEVYMEGRKSALKVQDVKGTLRLEEDALIGYAYDARHPDTDTAMDATYHYWYTRGRIDGLKGLQ